METKNKLGWADYVLIAIGRPKKYKELLQQNFGRQLGFFILILVLVSVIQFGIPIAAYLNSMGGIKNLAEHVIPTFTVQNGVLDMKEPMEVIANGCILRIDSSVEKYSVKDAKQKAEEYIEKLENEGEVEVEEPIVYMISKTNIVTNLLPVGSNLDTMFGMKFDNSQLTKQIPIYLILVGTIQIIIVTIGYVLGALFFSLFGYTMVKALKIEIQFSKIYLIALYAKALPILISAVLLSVGNTYLCLIGYMLTIIITCRYMVRGIVTVGNLDTRQDQTNS